MVASMGGKTNVSHTRTEYGRCVRSVRSGRVAAGMKKMGRRYCGGCGIGVSLGGLLLLVAALGFGVASAEIRVWDGQEYDVHRWNGLVVDWSKAYTKAELEAGLDIIGGSREKIATRVINGDIVQRMRQAPYVASLYYIRRNIWTAVCTAVVVDHSVVITAAHCVDQRNFGYGVCTAAVETDRGRCVRVKAIKLPPAYGRNLQYSTLTHDIALLQTNAKLIRPGSMAMKITVDLEGKVRRGENDSKKGMVLGYGLSNRRGNKIDGKLRTVGVRYEPFKDCWDDDGIKPFNFFCVLSNVNKGPCRGDSGSPLVFTNGSSDPTKHALVGTGSFIYTGGGKSCVTALPSGYVRLEARPVRRWLVKAMEKLGGTFNLFTEKDLLEA